MSPKKVAVTEEIDLGSHIKPQTKKLLITFSGSLNDLADNPDLTTWKTKTLDVFDMEDSNVDHRESAENALFVSASLSKIQSDFPCSLTMDISGIKKKNYSFNDGVKAHYVAFPNEVNHHLNEVLMSASKSLNTDYFVKHSGYTPNRLTKGITYLDDDPDTVYVVKDHPVIGLIRDNAKKLGIVLTKNDLITDSRYQIAKVTVEHCLESIREELNKELPIVNLNEFTVSIARPHNKSFCDVSGICDNLNGPSAIKKTMDMKRNLSCVLDLSYWCMPKSESKPKSK